MTIPASASASRFWATRLTVGALLGAIVGGILGGVVFGAFGTESTAVALIRLTPPPEFTAIATGADRTTPDTDVYISQYLAGEVAYLSGTGFSRSVAANLGQSEPDEIDVLREIGSSVVAISSSADSDADAVRTVQTAIDVYRAQVAQRAERQLRPILPALDEWEAAANAAGDAPRARQIQILRESLELQAGATANVTVLQPPTVDDVVARQWLIGAALGALIGGTAVPLGLMALRRRSGRVMSSAEVSAYVDGMMVPAVDLARVAPRSRSKNLIALARTLYAQCPSPGRARTIVIVGASPSSGTSSIAWLFEKAAAETEPVRSIRLRDESTASFRPIAGDATLIIDAGAIGESALIGEVVRQATELIMVARLNADTVQQIQAVRSATASGDAPLVAVLTYRPWSGFSRSGGGEDAVRERGPVGSAKGDSPTTTIESPHQ